MEFDSHVDVCARPRHDFDASFEICHSANMAGKENSNGVFSLDLKELQAVAQLDSVVEAWMVALECVCISEAPTTTRLTCWRLGKIALGRKRNSCTSQ